MLKIAAILRRLFIVSRYISDVNHYIGSFPGYFVHVADGTSDGIKIYA
jgi:hypothetical protein